MMLAAGPVATADPRRLRWWGTPSHTQGFTLIEILVVLVIISIVTAVAVLSLGTLAGDSAARRSAERLAALTDLASQQAVMRSEQYGLRISPHGYEFLLYDGGRWSAVQDDHLLRARHLGSGVTLALKLEGTDISFPAKAKRDHLGSGSGGFAKGQNLKPQVLLLSSGEVTPFTITISGNDGKTPYRVTGNLLRGIRFVPPEKNPRH